jgi:hypothetical protein
VQPKQLWVVDGAQHQDFLAYDSAGYNAHVIDFLVHYLRPTSGSVAIGAPSEGVAGSKSAKKVLVLVRRQKSPII